jgi:hypothetical protein
MILNITWGGVSAEVHVAVAPTIGDRQVKRLALALVRSGGVPGLHIPALPSDAFERFVVERFATPAGGRRVYLRPR